MTERLLVKYLELLDATQNIEDLEPYLQIPKTIPISPNYLEYNLRRIDSGIDAPFFSERPSIANPYGRAMVNEGVEVE
jgi:hypothetical protein